MRITSLAALGVSLSALLLAPACRGGDDSSDGSTDGNDVTPDGTTDGRPTDGPVNAGEVTIKQVQNDAMASGTQIELKGVIVTAIDTFGAKTGDLWVEDVGGGAFSGVKVFGANLTDVATLAVGDVVNITGAQKYEFACTGTICGGGVFDPGQTITEVEGTAAGSLVLTKVSSGTPITPDVVDANAIAALATKELRNAEWEKWEGVLITVTNVVQIGDKKPFSGADSEVDQFKFSIALDVNVETVMTDFPATAVSGFCYSSLTGVGDYFFQYLLLPRSAADFGAAGTGCPVNPTATVASIQMGTSTGAVTLNNVIVTARDDAAPTKGIFVADALTGAPYNGVFVYGSTIPAGAVIGATVNVMGTVTEFDVAPMGGTAMGDTLTEIKNPTVTIVSAPGPTLPVPATTAPIAQLSDIGTAGEPWEGVLVQLTNLKVTNNALGNNTIELTDNTGAKITMDDDVFLYVPVPANGTCYSTLSGVMSVQLVDNVRTLNPRQATDMVTGTGCTP